MLLKLCFMIESKNCLISFSTCSSSPKSPNSSIIITKTISLKKKKMWASLVVQTVKTRPAMQEPGVQSLGWEDPLGKETPNLAQYSCLENPTDRGVWQSTVHGVTKSQTRLNDFTFFLFFLNQNKAILKIK